MPDESKPTESATIETTDDKPKRRGRPPKAKSAEPESGSSPDTAESGPDVRHDEAHKDDESSSPSAPSRTVASEDAPKSTRTRKSVGANSKRASSAARKPRGGAKNDEIDAARVAIILVGGLAALGAIWYIRNRDKTKTAPEQSAAPSELEKAWAEVQNVIADINGRLEMRLSER